MRGLLLLITWYQEYVPGRPKAFAGVVSESE